MKLPKCAATDRYQTFAFNAWTDASRNETADTEVPVPIRCTNLCCLFDRVTPLYDTTLRVHVSYPSSHREVEITAEEAVELIILASYLLRLVDSRRQPEER